MNALSARIKNLSSDFIWDGDLVTPVYLIGKAVKETETGRILSDDESEDMMEEWSERHTFEERAGAEKKAEFLVLMGWLK